MKERFELVYYSLFMILGVGGLINFIVYYVLGNRNYDDFAIFIGIGFLMTLARFIYNGQHFWNPPFEKPSNKILILFVVASWIIVNIMVEGL